MSRHEVPERLVSSEQDDGNDHGGTSPDFVLGGLREWGVHGSTETGPDTDLSKGARDAKPSRTRTVPAKTDPATSGPLNACWGAG